MMGGLEDGALDVLVIECFFNQFFDKSCQNAWVFKGSNPNLDSQLRALAALAFKKARRPICILGGTARLWETAAGFDAATQRAIEYLRKLGLPTSNGAGWWTGFELNSSHHAYITPDNMEKFNSMVWDLVRMAYAFEPAYWRGKDLPNGLRQGQKVGTPQG